MRRDQVFRVCCNHAILPDMKLTKKKDSQGAWSWYTPMDATEEVPRAESFTIKFKTQEIAEKFREAFELCQQLVGSGEEIPASTANVAVVKDVQKQQEELTAKQSQAQRFVSYLLTHIN